MNGYRECTREAGRVESSDTPASGLGQELQVGAECGSTRIIHPMAPRKRLISVLFGAAENDSALSSYRSSSRFMLEAIQDPHNPGGTP